MFIKWDFYFLGGAGEYVHKKAERKSGILSGKIREFLDFLESGNPNCIITLHFFV